MTRCPTISEAKQAELQRTINAIALRPLDMTLAELVKSIAIHKEVLLKKDHHASGLAAGAAGTIDSIQVGMGRTDIDVIFSKPPDGGDGVPEFLDDDYQYFIAVRFALAEIDSSLEWPDAPLIEINAPVPLEQMSLEQLGVKLEWHMKVMEKHKKLRWAILRRIRNGLRAEVP